MYRIVFVPIILILNMLSCGFACGGDRVDNVDRNVAETRLPLNVCLVPEMGFVPELRMWRWCSADTEPAATKKLSELWPTEATRLRSIVTPDLARRLSRWAKPQMEGYHNVPPLEKVQLKPVATDRKSDDEQPSYIIFRGVIDTLPVHSPLVTRWLEVYVLYGVKSESILRSTITIRGQVLE